MNNVYSLLKAAGKNWKSCMCARPSTHVCRWGTQVGTQVGTRAAPPAHGSGLHLCIVQLNLTSCVTLASDSNALKLSFLI